MEHLIQHFRKDEQTFIERVTGWQRDVEDRYAPRLTDFLDPREQFIVTSIIGQNDELSVSSEGIFKQAERQRMMISPSYFELTESDFQISIFSIHYPSKFIQLQHRDVLGALLSLGLDRGKFGDIRLSGESIQFSVATEIEDYIFANLTTVGKAKVQLELVKNKESLIQNDEIWADKTYTVSSMRLDTVLATVLNISREKSKSLILASRVKVNWTVRESTSFEVQEGDIVSIRGFGRIKIAKTEGRTKKDKIRLQVGRLEQK